MPGPQGRGFPQAEFTSAEDEKREGPPRAKGPREPNARKPAYINTVWGYGYKWRG